MSSSDASRVSLIDSKEKTSESQQPATESERMKSENWNTKSSGVKLELHSLKE